MDKNWTTWNTQAMQALDHGDIEQAEQMCIRDRYSVISPTRV